MVEGGMMILVLMVVLEKILMIVWIIVERGKPWWKEASRSPAASRAGERGVCQTVEASGEQKQTCNHDDYDHGHDVDDDHDDDGELDKPETFNF